MYQNLNKKNFFDSMQERFPLAMEAFCNWIDEYKKEVDWNWLFGNSLTTPNIITMHEIKFHDIPFEMQVGIIIRYVGECDKNIGISVGSYTLDQAKYSLEQFFKYQEQQLCITKTSSTPAK